MMREEPFEEESEHFEFPAVRRMLFVQALFANGFRTGDAMTAAGYRGKELARRGRALVRRPDVQADIRQKLEKLEREDPRFSSQAILNEIAEVGYMEADSQSVGTKVRALELLGKYHKLFVERESLTIEDVNRLMTNMGLVVNQVIMQQVEDPELVSTINAQIRAGWLALRV